jgi:hypothetical protein
VAGRATPIAVRRSSIAGLLRVAPALVAGMAGPILRAVRGASALDATR